MFNATGFRKCWSLRWSNASSDFGFEVLVVFTPKIRTFWLECKWNTNFAFPKGIFPENHSFNGSTKFPMKFPNAKCAYQFHAFQILSVPMEKSAWKWNTHVSWKFPFGISMRSIYCRLSTNRFDRLNQVNNPGLCSHVIAKDKKRCSILSLSSTIELLRKLN